MGRAPLNDVAPYTYSSLYGNYMSLGASLVRYSPNLTSASHFFIVATRTQLIS